MTSPSLRRVEAQNLKWVTTTKPRNCQVRAIYGMSQVRAIYGMSSQGDQGIEYITHDPREGKWEKREFGAREAEGEGEQGARGVLTSRKRNSNMCEQNLVKSGNRI